MRFSSRKLLLAVALVALATWLLVLKAIDQATWLDIVRLALGGYFTANVAQKGVEAVQAYLERKAAPATTPP